MERMVKITRNSGKITRNNDKNYIVKKLLGRLYG